MTLTLRGRGTAHSGATSLAVAQSNGKRLENLLPHGADAARCDRLRQRVGDAGPVRDARTLLGRRADRRF
jgi:hypothetical protein